MIRLLLILVFLMAISSISEAQTLEETVVYRGVDGTLSQASKIGLSRFLRAAQQEGQIKIWVAFDMPFEGNPDLRTSEIVREEEAANNVSLQK